MSAKPMVEVRMRRTLFDSRGLVKGAPGSRWPADDPDVLRQPNAVQRVMEDEPSAAVQAAPAAPVINAAPAESAPEVVALEDDPAPVVMPRPRGWGKPKHHKPAPSKEHGEV